MSQYSSHRRPGAVPKVQKIGEFDNTGEGELKNRQNIEKALERMAGPAPRAKGKRSFADVLKQKK